MEINQKVNWQILNTQLTKEEWGQLLPCPFLLISDEFLDTRDSFSFARPIIPRISLDDVLQVTQSEVNADVHKWVREKVLGEYIEKLVSQATFEYAEGKPKISDIGEHGFSGKIYRLEWGSRTCVAKVSIWESGKDHECESWLLTEMSLLYASPVIPEVYLHASLNLDSGQSLSITLMEDLSWGKSDHYDFGLTIETLPPAIDDLAEFHAFQLLNRKATVDRVLGHS